ncbi:hypothetical protein AMECASPLE_029950 [Ameca splendens]|uniref:Uncharacterized protein n=1 Tax=Ameca splendens TaxID=208324 RepID=A0ABV0XIZ4_9TELE
MIIWLPWIQSEKFMSFCQKKTSARWATPDRSFSKAVWNEKDLWEDLHPEKRTQLQKGETYNGREGSLTGDLNKSQMMALLMTFSDLNISLCPC